MVLFIDDDREAFETLTELLSSHGYAVRYAANGREALRLLAVFHNRPALDSFGPGDAGTRSLGIPCRAQQRSTACRRSGRDNLGMS